ncbi:MAG: 3-hydroxyacyl-CoA dehydrogenase family protein [Bryobacter sp.]|nr:3-hydroxyacyl-CoA dehydrogenase family protein [Bryobacter sp.]
MTEPFSRPLRRAAVCGTGMMGPGIAATLAVGGMETVIVARREFKAWESLDTARQVVLLLEQNGLISPAHSNRALERLSATHFFVEGVEGRDLIIESVAEDMRVKQDWIRQVEEIVAPDAYITSNTSGLSITELASEAQHPERICTTHFWNPPHLVPLVEIVMSPRTSEAMAQDLKALLERCGKAPVIVRKDRPGQLGNRLQMALVREAVNIVSEGIATVEDVDKAASLGFGLRLPVYGIFEHADIVGLDLSYKVCDYVAQDLYSEKQAPELYAMLVRRGQLGAKTGSGFYDWSKKNADQVRNLRDRWLREFLRGDYGEKFRAQDEEPS